MEVYANEKRTSVTIAGNEYHLIGAENEEYTRRSCTFRQQDKRNPDSGNTRCLRPQSSPSQHRRRLLQVLDTADNLRAQLKEYLDQAGKMKMEISELKREIMRLAEYV